ncbi:DedA family protein [Devriesea agamarum]|uniref:DedA family protein n=1 Tax=Devriesea agamarum TaxID=472569 RepID=UPI00071CB172|nr:DedA family protein [Devriesea agamarum]
MNLLHLLTDTGPILSSLGVIGLVAFVFAESGLLIGFFLPGDSLLFMAGMMTTFEHPFAPLWLVCVAAPIAAILGDQVGYQIGRSTGPMILRRRSVKWMGPGAVDRAEKFFATYGNRTVVLARFVPVVRTLTPVIAGISRMNRRSFTLYNIVGGLLWGVGVVLLGYFLGGVTIIREHIDLIAVLIVVVSVLPIVRHVVKVRREAKREAAKGDVVLASHAPADKL